MSRTLTPEQALETVRRLAGGIALIPGDPDQHCPPVVMFSCEPHEQKFAPEFFAAFSALAGQKISAPMPEQVIEGAIHYRWPVIERDENGMRSNAAESLSRKEGNAVQRFLTALEANDIPIGHNEYLLPLTGGSLLGAQRYGEALKELRQLGPRMKIARLPGTDSCCIEIRDEALMGHTPESRKAVQHYAQMVARVLAGAAALPDQPAVLCYHPDCAVVSGLACRSLNMEQDAEKGVLHLGDAMRLAAKDPDGAGLEVNFASALRAPDYTKLAKDPCHLIGQALQQSGISTIDGLRNLPGTRTQA
ncbi:MAG: hypothetical protein WDN72_01130 [Alphaproteobacteria bacterium]